MSLLAAALAVGLAGVDFESSVLPVLEQKCFRCHRAAYEDEDGKLRRPKGDLRLDGRGWIEAGADGEAVLVPGDPEASLVYSLCVLPDDDADRMPKSGDGLTAREAEVLRRWIAEGAEFGDWVGELRSARADAEADAGEASSDVALPERLRRFVEVGAGLEAAPVAAVEKLRAAGARVERIVPGSEVLRVSFPGGGEGVGDEVGRLLEPVNRHVAWLDLSRTGVGDDVMRSVAGMSRLVRLDLRGTGVTDRGHEEIRGLGALEEVNLFGTGVTDRGLEIVVGVESVRVVRVGETRVTASAVTRARAMRPELRVVDGTGVVGGE